MPYPIQLGPMTDRLRNFFRLRGKTSFMLDEVVVPVTMIQDLTKGPYQAGVTPFAGNMAAGVTITPGSSSFAFVLEPKAGSQTPTVEVVRSMAGKSFSLTWIEFQNNTAGNLPTLQLHLISRTAWRAQGVLDRVGNPIGIQINHTVHPPLQIEGYDATVPVTTPDTILWSGTLGDNLNTTGSRREYEPEPNVTVGPDDALVGVIIGAAAGGTMSVNVRGFYQEQPQ